MQSKGPFASCPAFPHPFSPSLYAACRLAISPYGGHFLRPQNNDEMQLQQETGATVATIGQRTQRALWLDAPFCG